ncbi:endonuclease MutS2 [Methanohalophilus halophilus]|uniref:DNA-binding protein MutS2 n=2 Tax=Methanohalophilus halophilus TaxID=2177 RepID=A0A3M9L9E1_9EURY|nr:endonuclease MutS2 [Methanohalophilus halophilus]
MKSKVANNMQSLVDAPRIGEKMAQRFISHFGCEEDAMAAILRGDIASISEIEGVGRRYAISLVHDVRSAQDGLDISSFLKTRDSVDIYERVIDSIKNYASTPYARDKLHTYIPYPSSRKDLIDINRDWVENHMEYLSMLDDMDRISTILSRIKPLKNSPSIPRIRDRVIVTSNTDDYSTLKEKYGKNIEVQLVEDPLEFADVARSYPHVIAIGEPFLEYDFPESTNPEIVTNTRDIEEWHILPEKQISFFAFNHERIMNALDLAITLDKAGISSIINTDLSALCNLMAAINPEGNIVEGRDVEIDRLNHILDNVDSELTKYVGQCNREINDLLQKSSITLSGNDMLGVIRDEVELKDILSRNISASFSQIINDARKEFIETLSLKRNESLFVDYFFPSELCYPVEADTSQLQKFKDQIKQQIFRREVTHKRDIAYELHEFRQPLKQLVMRLLDLDVGLAVARFGHSLKMQLAGFEDECGMGLKNGKNIFLCEKGVAVEPIDYSLGSIMSPLQVPSSPVVLLSGVNSGGKTSMLELVAQCTILSHMGFPVPADELKIGPVDSLYYFSKSRGTLDAGAFETTLRSFSALAGAGSKLVLVDELESITEPGASAKIIAGILETLSEESNTMAIFVSHLADQILENTDASIRVDGIEAKGLDNELKLIVDRNPIYNHIAKSTPELIVERLFRSGGEVEREFYRRLKNKFEKGC